MWLHNWPENFENMMDKKWQQPQTQKAAKNFSSDFDFLFIFVCQPIFEENNAQCRILGTGYWLVVIVAPCIMPDDEALQVLIGSL